MSLNKGLALAGAMLVVAIPAQPAVLHAQSVPTNTITIRTTEGVRVITLSTPPGVVPPRNPVVLTPTVQSPIFQLPTAEVPTAQPGQEAAQPVAVQPAPVAAVQPASSRRRSTRRAVPVVARTPAATSAAEAALNSSIFAWLSGLVNPTEPSVAAAPVVSAPAPAPEPAPAPAPTPVVSQPAPAPVPESAPAPAPAPEAAPGTGSSPVSDAVGAVVEAVTEVVNTVVEAVADAAEAVAEAVAEVVSPTPGTAPVQPAVSASQPAPVVTQPAAPIQPAQTQPAAPVAAPNVAKVFTVSTRAELRAALTEAQGLAGAEIRVNPGDYGDWQWNFKKYPLGRVYIVAATSTMPVFRSIQANSSSNMSFHGIKVAGQTSGAAVQMNSSRNMSFTGGEIAGQTQDLLPRDEAATGIQVRFSTNVVVQDVRFSDLRAAMYVQRSKDVAIRYNRLHYIREGMNLVAVENLQVRGNHFSHFYPRYDLKEHPDALQLWTNGETVGSTTVRISENLISMGGPRAVQGLLAGCEAAGVRHKDWEVSRNVYFGSSLHGLSFYCVDGLKTWNNVVVASPHADLNKSRTALTDPAESGGFLPRLRMVNVTDAAAWNNVLMANLSLNNTVVNRYDNWDIVDAMGWGGLAWTEIFADGRPTSEAPPLTAFLTKNPSAAYSRNGGVTAPFVHGTRSLTKNQALAEVLQFLGA